MAADKYRVVQKRLKWLEWLKSALNYRSYPKNKTGYPFLDHPHVHTLYTQLIIQEQKYIKGDRRHRWCIRRSELKFVNSAAQGGPKK